MPNPSLFFSSPNYYKNPHFQRCMRNWNMYLNTEENDDDVLAEWEEILYKDFLQHSKEWLHNNYNMIHWKVGLE